jgi:uncharacterized radical SAM superfamily protein
MSDNLSAPLVGSTADLTHAEQLKFALLSDGLVISPEALEYIATYNGSRPMTPADYASTSGVILQLDVDVWINAPIELYNPNFVKESDFVLTLDESGGLEVRGRGLSVKAGFWLPPQYHGQSNANGVEYNSLAFTHGDRVRVSPVEGCAMSCQFCNLPYEFKYRTKSVEDLVESVMVAVNDPLQPASHVLISGGTPKAEDVEYLQECYEAVISRSGVPVDIMMVPTPGLLDVPWLAELGVNELSINLEIFDEALARRYMKLKTANGVDYYLDFIESASETLGPGRVRSMLMIGIESMESTLAGVDAICARGGTPVLSPFRPDPATPMRKWSPPTADFVAEAYFRAREIADQRGVALGPDCIPCTHNTMTLAASGNGDARRYYGTPNLI